jgi:hypothetical protein
MRYLVVLIGLIGLPVAHAQAMIVACPDQWGDNGGVTGTGLQKCTGCGTPVWTRADASDNVKTNASRNSWPKLGSLKSTDLVAIAPAGAVEGAKADCSLITAAQTVAEVLGTTNPPPATSATGDASIIWGVPTTNRDGTALTDLAGYRVEYGQGGTFDAAVIVGPSVTSYQFVSIAVGTWQARVITLAKSGESAPSNAVSFTVAPSDPPPSPPPPPPPPATSWVVAMNGSAATRPAIEAVLDASGKSLVRGNQDGTIAIGKPCGAEIFKSGSSSYRQISNADAQLASPTYATRQHVAVCVLRTAP